MGVSKNRGTPKWMVKIMENAIKMDDLGGNTPIFGTTHMHIPPFLIIKPPPGCFTDPVTGQGLPTLLLHTLPYNCPLGRPVSSAWVFWSTRE